MRENDSVISSVAFQFFGAILLGGLILALTVSHFSRDERRLCQKLEHDLKVVAWNDPDAYDFEHLQEVGAGIYMCGYAGGISESGTPREVVTLCQQYISSCIGVAP